MKMTNTAGGHTVQSYQSNAVVTSKKKTNKKHSHLQKMFSHDFARLEDKISLKQEKIQKIKQKRHS